ncbi:MAG: cyclic nucleotide-binding domain-containing protein [Elusimicrobia bacterium]|nr:cyclic nucleotide-binding domain-containing protein [Elusimicrobiota bacterium]
MLKVLRSFFSDPVFVKKKAFLKSLPLFKELGERELGYVLQAFHSRVYHEGEVLFMEGDIGRALFIIESGRVELTKLDAGGKPKQIVVLGPGDFFGEMALLEQLPRSATATAQEKSHVHLLYRSRIESLLHRHPRIGVSIMTHLAQLLSARLRRATQQLTTSDRVERDL